MKNKLFAVIFAAILITNITASAEVLGTVTGGWSTYMGADTYFHNVQFTSDSVGLQNEYYVEYMPNEEAVPVIINGSSIWGTRDIKEAEQYMKDNGLRPLVGINADYFSFKTGIPMGYTIIDGEIVSKEYGGQDAVGFRSDGTGFIKWLDIATTVSDGEKTVDVMYINKWCQPGFDPIYMLTDKFGKTTKTSSECIFVICSPVDGTLSIDTSMTMTVDDIFIYNGEIEIPEGKIVMLMDTSGDANCYDFLSRLAVGDTVTVTNTAVGDDGTWKTAQNGVSSVGGRLISGGVVNSNFEAGAAPRTAVGIKADGNIIFYTIDGRQQGYSYGAQLKTLAQRMAELGCVDAINLDGGGSTVISAVFPGNDFSTTVNSPSDGYLRNVANFIFLKDNRERTDVPWIVTLKDAGNTNYLSGMSTVVEVESVYDTANYKMEDMSGLTMGVDTETASTIDDSGYLQLLGTGDVNVVISGSGGDVASRLYNVYETPEEIKVFNQADWKEISEIYTAPNEELQLNLSAGSYINGTELLSNNSLYTWEVEGDIGTITPEGIFTLADTVNKEGKIKVSVGGCTKEIPVHIADYPKVTVEFADTENHWAKDIISQMAGEGIINGIEEDGKLLFKPDNNTTRAEFASMIVKYQGIDVSQYEDVSLDFTDSDEIPLWAENIIKAAYSEGIIQGRINDDGTVTFAPYDNITRAEAMTIIGRIIPDNDDLPNLPFADSDQIPDWAVEGMQKLYSIGVINGYEDNTILPNNNIKRAEAASILYKLMNN